jgi:hypothetical protein
MSIATALTLVANGAFFIKILALVAAVLFSFALGARVRSGRGGVAAGVVGAVFLFWALWLFVGTRGLNTGAMLVGAVVALFAVAVLALRGRERADALAQVLAVGTVLGWLTVTLAGRWIGFS